MAPGQAPSAGRIGVADHGLVEELGIEGSHTEADHMTGDCTAGFCTVPCRGSIAKASNID